MRYNELQELTLILTLFALFLGGCADHWSNNPNEKFIKNDTDYKIVDHELTPSKSNVETESVNTQQNSDLSKENFLNKYSENKLLAEVKLAGLDNNSGTEGIGKFYKDDHDHLRVVAYVRGLEPNSKHGFHVHEFGSCKDHGKAAGSHFDPDNTQHHDKPNVARSHAGDMGNLVADSKGVAYYDGVLPVNIKAVADFHKFINRAVIIHDKEDHFTQPTGDAGSRIACGLIKSE